MSVSSALVSLFIPFIQHHINHSRIGRISLFTSVSFVSTHDFMILCNYHEFLSSQQKIWPRIEGIMTTIGKYVVVFNMSCTKSSLKNSPLLLGFLQNMDIAPVSYPFTFGIFFFFHLNCRAWSVIHTTSFSDFLFPISPKCFYCTDYFTGKFAKECTIVGLLYPV